MADELRAEALGGDGRHPVLIAEFQPTLSFDHLAEALAIADHPRTLNSAFTALSRSEATELASLMRSERGHFKKEVTASEDRLARDKRRVDLRVEAALEFWDTAAAWLEEAGRHEGAIVGISSVPPDLIEVGKRAHGRGEGESTGGV